MLIEVFEIRKEKCYIVCMGTCENNETLDIYIASFIMTTFPTTSFITTNFIMVSFPTVTFPTTAFIMISFET